MFKKNVLLLENGKQFYWARCPAFQPWLMGSENMEWAGHVNGLVSFNCFWNIELVDKKQSFYYKQIIIPGTDIFVLYL